MMRLSAALTRRAAGAGFGAVLDAVLDAGDAVAVDVTADIDTADIGTATASEACLAVAAVFNGIPMSDMTAAKAGDDCAAREWLK